MISASKSIHPTCFSQMIGNEEIKKQLQRMISKRAVGHALLFAGPDGVGKSLFAWAFAAQMMQRDDQQESHVRKLAAGQHPDVHVYRPEGKLGLHSIHSLRQLSEEVYLPPYESSWKVFIIDAAERMLSYSANALLKTFEEPPPRTLMILLTHSPSALLPTLLSRCSTLHFQSIADDLIRTFLKQHYQLEEGRCERVVRQAQGSLGRAVRLASQGDALRVAVYQFLAHGPFVDYRSFQKGIQGMTEQIDIAKKHAEETAKGELYQPEMEYLSAQHQHALEKELEGLTALALAQEAQGLLEDVLLWYRDLQLILLGGSAENLANPDFKWELEQAVQRGDFKPLDEVCRAVEEAHLALQRSTALAVCLENLFLKLDRI